VVTPPPGAPVSSPRPPTYYRSSATRRLSGSAKTHGAEFVPFLRFENEIGTSNAIEQAGLECLSLALMSLDPGGKGRQRWSDRWEGALNAFDIAGGRLSAERK
jgi:hypothetical protein